MKKIILFIFIFSLGGLIVGCSVQNNDVQGKVPVTSKVSNTKIERQVATNTKSGRTVTIPENAIQVADQVFSLGSTQVNGDTVSGLMFVDYKKAYEKTSLSTSQITTEKCYAFLARGTKWKNIENYLIDSTNAAGLTDSFIRERIALDTVKWETASGKNIFGTETIGTVDGVDMNSPDGKNEVLFADITDANAIAVTIVWGIFGGSPSQRKIIEWDQVYDDRDFTWSSTGEEGKMDFENIATHELGHAAGMGHPSNTCLEETMYRYADYGETKKRDLNVGDREGIIVLYK